MRERPLNAREVGIEVNERQAGRGINAVGWERRNKESGWEKWEKWSEVECDSFFVFC